MASRSGATSKGGSGLGGYVVAAQFVLALLIAFGIGWFLGERTAGSRAGSSPPPVQVNELQAAIENASKVDRIGQLEKQVADLQKENAGLRKEKSELENRLSIAADVANRMNRALDEERRKTEDAEWKARQAQPSFPTAPPPGP